MTTNPTRKYTKSTPINEAVEVRLTLRNSNRALVLSAWLHEATGTVGYTLSQASGGGYNESLSNLQARATFPRKAVAGWQAEVVAFAASGIFDITEVR